MPLIYTVTPAAPGNLTTSGTPSTETETFYLKAGARNVTLKAIWVIGKAALLTTLNGIAFRLLKWGTSSTLGTGMTPNPKDAGYQVAKTTAASRPTSGTSRTNHTVFGCGAAGPFNYFPPDIDSPLSLEGSALNSISMMDVSGGTSLNFEFSADIAE